MVYALAVASTERALLLYNRLQKELLYGVSSALPGLPRAAAVPHTCRVASRKPGKQKKKREKQKQKQGQRRERRCSNQQTATCHRPKMRLRSSQQTRSTGALTLHESTSFDSPGGGGGGRGGVPEGWPEGTDVRPEVCRRKEGLFTADWGQKQPFRGGDKRW